MSPLTTVAVTAGIIVLSAFFVVIEFSLLAARRHRLQETAESHRSSRAALRSLNELTLMLAGAQLGITACTFALGAITKPAVHSAMTPVFSHWGVPWWIADLSAFVLALVAVTFLHLVVGEMTPKSWAIAHPERSARAIALPARAFITLLRPLLSWINQIANRLVAAAGVEPVDRAAAAGYDSATIRSLVEDSTEAGVLDEAAGSQISRIIGLETLTVDDVVAARTTAATSVGGDARAADIQRAAERTGHMRVLLNPAGPGPRQVVHVRDTLNVDPEHPATDLARDALEVSSDTSVYEAFQLMRTHSEQLAVVHTESEFLGVITWADVLKQIWPVVEEQLTDSSQFRQSTGADLT